MPAGKLAHPMFLALLVAVVSPAVAYDETEDVYEEYGMPEFTGDESDGEEDRWILPDWPDESGLLRVDTRLKNYPYELLIDKKSLSVGKDRTVRYTVVLRSGAGVDNEITHDGTALPGNDVVDSTLGELAAHTILDDLLKPLTRVTLVTHDGRVETPYIGNPPHNVRINNHVFLLDRQKTFGVNIQRQNAPIKLANVIDERHLEMQSGLDVRAHDLTQTEQHGLFPGCHLEHGGDTHEHGYQKRQE